MMKKSIRTRKALGKATIHDVSQKTKSTIKHSLLKITLLSDIFQKLITNL